MADDGYWIVKRGYRPCLPTIQFFYTEFPDGSAGLHAIIDEPRGPINRYRVVTNAIRQILRLCEEGH